MGERGQEVQTSWAVTYSVVIIVNNTASQIQKLLRIGLRSPQYKKKKKCCDYKVMDVN